MIVLSRQGLNTSNILASVWRPVPNSAGALNSAGILRRHTLVLFEKSPNCNAGGNTAIQ